MFIYPLVVVVVVAVSLPLGVTEALWASELNLDDFESHCGGD